MPNPLQRSADIFNELILQAQTTAIGRTANAGNPGQMITATFEGIGTVTGRCGNVITPGAVQGILSVDGAWTILGTNAPSLSQQRRQIRHSQPEEYLTLDVLVLILQQDTFVNETDSRQTIGPVRVYVKNSRRPLVQIGEIPEVIPGGTFDFGVSMETSSLPAGGGKYLIQTMRGKDLVGSLNRYTVYTYLVKNGRLLDSLVLTVEGTGSFSTTLTYPEAWQSYTPYLWERPNWDSIPVYENIEDVDVRSLFEFPWRNKVEQFIRYPNWNDSFGRPSWGMLLQPTKYQLKGKPPSLRFQLSDFDLSILSFTRLTPLQSIVGSVTLPYVVQDYVDRPAELVSGIGGRLDRLWANNKVSYFLSVRGHVS